MSDAKSMQSEETTPLLHFEPSTQPGCRPDTGLVRRTGIPQPDGSVLFVEGASLTGNTHGNAIRSDHSERDPSYTSHEDGGNVRPKPPTPPVQAYDPAPGDVRWSNMGIGDREPYEHSATQPPDFGGHTPREKPEAGPAPDGLEGARGEGAGYRPPPSEGAQFDPGSGWAPKPSQLEPNPAPDREQRVSVPEEPPSYHEMHPAPPIHDPYSQPLHPDNHTGYGAVLQQPAINWQPPPLKPVGTSRKFDSKRLHENQYYVSICIFIVMCVFCNPCPIICAIAGFILARKAATANDNAQTDEARKKERKARNCNIVAAVCCVFTAFANLIGAILLFSVLMALYGPDLPEQS